MIPPMFAASPVPMRSGAMNSPKLSPNTTISTLVISCCRRRPMRSASHPEIGTNTAKNTIAASWIFRNVW